MTVNSTTRKTSTFVGNGSTTSLPFSFVVFATTDIVVTKADSDGTETVLTLGTDYTVTLNSNQSSSPGGSVTLTSALATGYTAVVSSAVAALQKTDITNQGGFYPEVIETALDKLTVLIQQAYESLSRAIKVPITSSADTETLVSNISRIVDSADNIDTVAGDIANIDTVADNIDSVNTAAANVADITNFADVYQGPSSSDPTTRADGSALQEGDLYFSTSIKRMMTYDGSGWYVTYQAVLNNETTTYNLITVGGVLALIQQ
jgi:hypothetical protein